MYDHNSTHFQEMQSLVCRLVSRSKLNVIVLLNFLHLMQVFDMIQNATNSVLINCSVQYFIPTIDLSKSAITAGDVNFYAWVRFHVMTLLIWNVL
jgi:hypothetical protein